MSERRIEGFFHGLYMDSAILAESGVLAGNPRYSLLEAPRADERNPSYALRLQRTLRELAFPAEYVNSLVTSDA